MMRAAKVFTTTTAAIILAAGAVTAPTVFALEPAVTDVPVTLSVPAKGVAVTAVAAKAAIEKKKNRKPSKNRKPVLRDETCTDPTVNILREVGFRGNNVREAYAIAWRESNGQADLGPGHPQYNGSDMGLFQFNRPTFGNESWWNESKMLDAHYNASIAYRLSKGGKTWWLWGMDGQGNTNAEAYRGIWSESQIYAWITEPYQRYAKQFDKLPKACR